MTRRRPTGASFAEETARSRLVSSADRPRGTAENLRRMTGWQHAAGPWPAVSDSGSVEWPISTAKDSIGVDRRIGAGGSASCVRCECHAVLARSRL